MRIFLRHLACIALLLASVAPAVSRAADPGKLAGTTFVVDPGHGTKRPDGTWLNVGAVAPDGLPENQVSLKVSERLRALLERSGAHVVMTRSFAHPYRVGTVIRVDNRARAALANSIGATAFVAIHCDSSLDHAQRGTSVFWLRDNSVALANAVRAHLAPLGLGESQFRARDLAVTSEARVPAVLIELGFISNAEQEALLRSPEFQEREATAIYDAIAETFGR